MSNPLAHYSFLPWLRRGIGNMIEEQDAKGTAPTGAMAKERANIQVGVTITSTEIENDVETPDSINKSFQFLGPPDIVGISERAIVRVEPKNGVSNYEDNGLPYIEFYEEDFLWKYSPAKSGTGPNQGKLTPWLALICLKDDEFDLQKDGDGRATIRIANTAMSEVFHSETQHWAWAHVHLNTELDASGLSAQIGEVDQKLNSDPDNGCSRLLCPRKLIANTAYTACLIPTYETGRLSGLGQDFTGVFAQETSWATGRDYSTRERGYEYPAYYTWRFQTDDKGDFESLARLLEAIVAPPELGSRDMYINAPGLGLDGKANSETLGLEGALKPTNHAPAAWPNGAGDTTYREQVRKLLNLSLDNENQFVSLDSLSTHPFGWGLNADPIVTPHIYGRWHGLVQRLQSGSNPAWVNQLNLDPRNRAAAGLGTQVVQEKQEDYMKEAWQQVEAINEANEKIRKATLAGLVNSALYHKHIGRARDDQKIRLTKPVHKVVTRNGATIHKEISNSLVPNASQSAAFRKITRPGKTLNKKLNKLGVGSASLLHELVTENFDVDQIKTAPNKDKVFSAVATNVVGSTISNALATYTANDKAMATQAVFEVIQGEITDPALFNQMPSRKLILKGKIDQIQGLSPGAIADAKILIDGIDQATHGGATSNHLVRVVVPKFVAHFQTPTGSTDTAKIYQDMVILMDTNGAPGSMSTVTTAADIQLFQSAFSNFSTYAIANAIGVPNLPPLGTANIGLIKTGIETSMNQKVQMLTRVARGITVKTFNNTTQSYDSTPLPEMKQIMAHPEFDEPMFRDLKKISKDYILPNVSLVPNNSLTILSTNQRFIESYMAGLNHEMARELLWREFPTDQRGSYFRQFWDVSDDIHTASAELKLDIEKLHTWQSTLGDHNPRSIGNSSGDYLVLLIRGDLLRKYPNTQVYAHKAAYKNASPSAPRDLADMSVPGNVMFPLFMAELEPDIFLFGFDLEIADARGDVSNINKPGWYFVLRERPGQIRFGLDDWPAGQMPPAAPNDWNNLSWEHMVGSASQLANYQLDAQFNLAGAGSSNSPQAIWGKNAADMAYILYQNPVLYARHANEMLPA
jgi:hypothetical protein